MSGPIELGWWTLAAAAALILINAGLSIWLRLGLERKLAVASFRAMIQLLLLGYLLLPVFEWRHPLAVGALAMGMIALASREALRRAGRTFDGAWSGVFVSLLVAALVTTLYGTAVIIQVDPWWQPRYLIPLLGMVLGNALTGISLGLDRGLSAFDEGRGQVESLLALGATRWEAARPVVRDAVRTGMVPILNTMSVVGLVSIPGMMTGQILGGTPPEQAARYQILILFLITGATGLGVVGSILFTLRSVFDDQHRLRPERIRIH